MLGKFFDSFWYFFSDFFFYLLASQESVSSVQRIHGTAETKEGRRPQTKRNGKLIAHLYLLHNGMCIVIAILELGGYFVKMSWKNFTILGISLLGNFVYWREILVIGGRFAPMHMKNLCKPIVGNLIYVVEDKILLQKQRPRSRFCPNLGHMWGWGEGDAAPLVSYCFCDFPICLTQSNCSVFTVSYLHASRKYNITWPLGCWVLGTLAWRNGLSG